jgi:hypothetical protein
MAGFRFLVKTDAALGHALAAAQTPFGPMALRFTPLLPYTGRAAGIGLSGGRDSIRRPPGMNAITVWHPDRPWPRRAA